MKNFRSDGKNVLGKFSMGYFFLPLSSWSVLQCANLAQVETTFPSISFSLCSRPFGQKLHWWELERESEVEDFTLWISSWPEVVIVRCRHWWIHFCPHSHRLHIKLLFPAVKPNDKVTSSPATVFPGLLHDQPFTFPLWDLDGCGFRSAG